MSEDKNYNEKEDQNQENQENQENTEKKDLGKVDNPSKRKSKTKVVSQEELNEKAKSSLGFVKLDLSKLPTKGMFYPKNTEIRIRAAKTNEIKDYSLMDETNPLDINDRINNMLSFCTEVTFNGNKASYKDLVEDDKMYIILSIKEQTFKDGGNKLTIKSVCDKCNTENQFELSTENLNYYEQNETISKYYDSENRYYVIETKKHGDIHMTPPKIGVMQEVTDYAKNKEENKQKWDKSAINILPYLIIDWRGLDEKKIFDELVEMEGMSREKFSLVYRLTEMLRNEIKQQLTFHCKNCGNKMNVDVEIEGGMKSIFIKSNIEDDLV